MTQYMTELERKRLLEVAREYRKQGYTVILEPQGKQVPEFIAPFIPHMLVFNEHEHVAIVVKSQQTLASSSELQGIAKAIHGRKGWRFELVVTNPKDKGISTLESATVMDTQEIRQRLQEAQILSEQEFGEAAFVLAWSAAEAILRTIAKREGIGKDRETFEVLSKNLYTQGVLEKEQYEGLVEAARARNSIVHGFREPKSLVETYGKVVSITKELLTNTAPA